MFIYLFICLLIYLFFYLFIYLSIYLFTDLFINLFFYLFKISVQIGLKFQALSIVIHSNSTLSDSLTVAKSSFQTIFQIFLCPKYHKLKLSCVGYK